MQPRGRLDTENSTDGLLTDLAEDRVVVDGAGSDCHVVPLRPVEDHILDMEVYGYGQRPPVIDGRI